MHTQWKQVQRYRNPGFAAVPEARTQSWWFLFPLLSPYFLCPWKFSCSAGLHSDVNVKTWSIAFSIPFWVFCYSFLLVCTTGYWRGRLSLEMPVFQTCPCTGHTAASQGGWGFSGWEQSLPEYRHLPWPLVCDMSLKRSSGGSTVFQIEDSVAVWWWNCFFGVGGISYISKPQSCQDKKKLFLRGLFTRE